MFAHKVRAATSRPAAGVAFRKGHLTGSWRGGGCRRRGLQLPLASISPHCQQEWGTRGCLLSSLHHAPAPEIENSAVILKPAVCNSSERVLTNISRLIETALLTCSLCSKYCVGSFCPLMYLVQLTERVNCCARQSLSSDSFESQSKVIGRSWE